jgi:hypothetical protein
VEINVGYVITFGSGGDITTYVTTGGTDDGVDNKKAYSELFALHLVKML